MATPNLQNLTGNDAEPVATLFDGIKSKGPSSATNNAYLGRIAGSANQTFTSGWMDLTGLQGFTLEVDPDNFLGSWRIEVSNDDNATKVRIYVLDRDNCPLVPQSSDHMIVSGDGWKYLRVVGNALPLNTGSVDFFVRTFDPFVARTPQNGYADVHQRQQLLIDQSTSSDYAKIDFRTKGSGVRILLNVRTVNNCSPMFTFYGKDVYSGNYSQVYQTPEPIASVGEYIFLIHPAAVPVVYSTPDGRGALLYPFNVAVANDGGNEWAFDTTGISGVANNNLTFSLCVEGVA